MLKRSGGQMLEARMIPGNGNLSSDCSFDNANLAAKGYIEHHVSKLDTLAGIAIKYGVEVVDIKQANGLVTDLQMYAHKSLKIPLLQRHLLTTDCGHQCASTSSIPSESKYSDKRPLSSAMNLLRGYYGLSSPGRQAANGVESISYRSDGEDFSEDEPFSPLTKPDLTLDIRGNAANGNKHNSSVRAKGGSNLSHDGSSRGEIVPVMAMGDAEQANERSVRRRSKVDSEFANNQEFSIFDRTPPKPVRSSGGDKYGGGMIARLSKGLDAPSAGGKGVEVPASRVIKSLSTSNLQDLNETNVTQANARSLFEGLSNPVGHRHKAALD